MKYGVVVGVYFFVVSLIAAGDVELRDEYVNHTDNIIIISQLF